MIITLMLKFHFFAFFCATE